LRQLAAGALPAGEAPFVGRLNSQTDGDDETHRTLRVDPRLSPIALADQRNQRGVESAAGISPKGSDTWLER
jgi:hypothetical protein